MIFTALAAIPTIIDAISGVGDLMDAGKDMVDQISGKPSKATTKEELHREIADMTPEQQEQWASAMQTRVQQYEAETGRLLIEQGQVNSETLETLTPKARDKVALLRMTTRPWAVRKMVHLMMLPAYIMFVDGILALLNIFVRFGYEVAGKTNVPQFDMLAATFFSENSIYATMYAEAAPWASSIVITYMTLRQFQKSKGSANPVSGIAGMMRNAGGAIGSLMKKF